MRDKLKTPDYFEREIIDIKESIDRKTHSIVRGEALVDKINVLKRATVWDYISIIGCKYSIGSEPDEIIPDLINAINLTDESWDGFWKVHYKGKCLNQLGLDAYDQMLWMLSLGYLFDIPNECFQKLVGVIDRYQVKDFLFEFIIRAKIKDRKPITEESYQRFFGIPDTFNTLRQAITETDKEKAEALVKQFVTKEWYKGHKGTGWYNGHKNPHRAYHGYWCFEAAAVVKIMGLDDSSFRYSQYYPKEPIYPERPDGGIIRKMVIKNPVSFLNNIFMRDKFKTPDYFERKILAKQEAINMVYKWIETGETPADKVNLQKRSLVWDYISIIGCRYSMGSELVEIIPDLINAINLTDESWDGFWKIDYKGETLDQYSLSAYDQMLWMLSLGYLLDIPNKDFRKLIDVIDREQVKDFLFEFLIGAKMKDRKPITEESYQRFFGIPHTFNTLRQAIIETNKEKAEALVKQFVTKEWYKGHKETGWYNSHKSPYDIYHGYWCFEAAAVVKIMGLDDSGFRESKYYPKDLVNVKNLMT